MVEWLDRRDCNRRGLGSKPTGGICLCSGERHFTTLFHAWWLWQAFLNFINISIKFQADNNILVFPKAGRSNCLAYVLAPDTFTQANCLAVTGISYMLSSVLQSNMHKKLFHPGVTCMLHYIRSKNLRFPQSMLSVLFLVVKSVFKLNCFLFVDSWPLN